MSIFATVKVTGASAQDLDERSWLSTTLQTADEGYKYNPNHVLVDPPESVSRLYVFPSIHRNYFSSSKVNSPTQFYRGVHFTIGETLYDGSRYSMGVLADSVTILVSVQSMSKFSEIVSSISISEGYGVEISGIMDGDTFNPYEEKTLTITADASGSSIILADIELVLEGDDNTYYFTLYGLRFALPYMLSANWESSITMTRNYLTSVWSAYDSSETRKALRQYPILSMDCDLTFPSITTAAQAWQMVRTRASSTHILPCYPDEQCMTASSTSTMIYADTTYRRFSEGCLAVALKVDSDLSVINYAVFTISSMTDSSLTPVSELDVFFDEGDLVLPAMACVPSYGADSIEMDTDWVGNINIDATELYANTSIGREYSDYTPTESNDLPVFPFSHNWNEDPGVSISFQGEVNDSGRGQTYYLQGSLPYQTHTISMLFESRKEWWEAVGFFNYIKGQARAFWVPNPLYFINPITEYNASIIVEELTVDDWGYLSALWLEDSDGTIEVVSVISISDTTEGFQIFFDTPSITPIYYYQALKARLNSDEVVEEWITTEIVQIEVEIKELQGAY